MISSMDVNRDVCRGCSQSMRTGDPGWLCGYETQGESLLCAQEGDRPSHSSDENPLVIKEIND